MKITKLIILGILMVQLTSKGQEKIHLYFNWDWEITSKEKIAYSREAEYDLNTMKLNGKVVDHNRLGEKIMEGNYANGKKNGPFIFYYRSGIIESKGEYSENKRVGKWEYYYPNGNLKQMISYSGNPAQQEFVVSEYYDRDGNQLIRNGTGQWVNDSVRTGLFESGLKKLTGEFKDSLKEGTWKAIRLSDKKLVYIERFKKGKFVSGQVYNPQFKEMAGMNVEMLNKNPDAYNYKLSTTEKFQLDKTVYGDSLINADVETIFGTVTGKEIKIMNRNAMYPGGDYGLLSFIGKRLRYPVEAMVRRIKGTVYVSVEIDSLGNTKDVKVLKGVSSELNNESLRVVEMIDKWLPKIQDGKPVESRITIPVKFDLKN